MDLSSSLFDFEFGAEFEYLDKDFAASFGFGGAAFDATFGNFASPCPPSSSLLSPQVSTDVVWRMVGSHHPHAPPILKAVSLPSLAPLLANI